MVLACYRDKRVAAVNTTAVMHALTHVVDERVGEGGGVEHIAKLLTWQADSVVNVFKLICGIQLLTKLQPTRWQSRLSLPAGGTMWTFTPKRN